MNVRTFGILPKTVQYLYAARDLPSGVVDACLLLDKPFIVRVNSGSVVSV